MILIKFLSFYTLMEEKKYLGKDRWMRWRVSVEKKRVTAWAETRSFSPHGITQSFQNFNVIFFVDRLTSWSKFVVHNTLTVEKKARTCSVTRVRNEVPFVREREREGKNYFLFWRIDIETAKIVRFLQFKLCCKANKKKIWNVRKLIENFAKCKTLHFRKIYKS